jgi:2-polyprenyl-6-methoxyphenol hydroxylase-like FAD-dependent oxidoreductase
VVDRFGSGRAWLAGDAAHATGPVGVQSMNVGLREAHDLAERISAIVKSGDDLSTLERYDAERRHEWRRLLNLDAGLRPTGPTSAWSGERAERLLPCVPASGEDLDTLLRQAGILRA